MAYNMKNNFIVYLRSIATLCIVACHLVNMSNFTIVRFSGQFMNVGVQLFLIISAFLYGQRKIESPYHTWICQRLRKLLLPMYVLLVILFIGNFVVGESILFKQVISYVFNIQGLTGWYIQGAPHLWYLSIAMICYMLTPQLQRYKEVIKKRLILIGGGLLLLQVVVAYLWSERYASYLILVFLYITAYVASCNWEKLTIGRKTFIYSIAAIVFALVGRLVGRMLCDGSILYNVFIAGYTHVVLAFGIFFAVAFVYKRIEDKKVPTVIKWIDSYSYEIYLVHFMFYAGPFYIGITDRVVANWMLIIVAIVISAIFLKEISGWVLKITDNVSTK